MSKTFKQKREGSLLVELSQKHGYVFHPKPKSSMSMNMKTGNVTPYLEYRISVPVDSALAALLPRRTRMPKAATK